MDSISSCRRSRRHHQHRRLQASSRHRGTANGGLPPRTSPSLHRHATPLLTIVHTRPARPLHTCRSTKTHCQRARLQRAARHHRLHLRHQRRQRHTTMRSWHAPKPTRRLPTGPYSSDLLDCTKTVMVLAQAQPPTHVHARDNRKLWFDNSSMTQQLPRLLSTPPPTHSSPTTTPGTPVSQLYRDALLACTAADKARADLLTAQLCASNQREVGGRPVVLMCVRDAYQRKLSRYEELLQQRQHDADTAEAAWRQSSPGSPPIPRLAF